MYNDDPLELLKQLPQLNWKPMKPGSLKIGDVCIWKWTLEYHPDPMDTIHTRLTVVDESLSKSSYDYVVQSDSGNLSYEREDDLLVIQTARPTE